MKHTRRSFMKCAIAAVVGATLPLPKLVAKKVVKYVCWPCMTLLDLTRRGNNKSLLDIAEVLNETNEILKDAVWVETEQLKR